MTPIGLLVQLLDTLKLVSLYFLANLLSLGKQESITLYHDLLLRPSTWQWPRLLVSWNGIKLYCWVGVFIIQRELRCFMTVSLPYIYQSIYCFMNEQNTLTYIVILFAILSKNAWFVHQMFQLTLNWLILIIVIIFR